MKRKLKVKIARLVHSESGAHMRARIKRQMREDGHVANVSNWFIQGNRNIS